MKNNIPENNIIILVSERERLEELTAKSEIGSIINTAIDSQPSFMGLAGKVARNAYIKIEKKALKNLSNQELIDRFNKSIELGFPVAWHTPLEAKNKFDFGVGHIPQDGSFYVQHPIKNKAYISPSEFSRSICAEKEAAFLRLAAALGAKSIQLTSIQTNDTRGIFSSKLKASEVAAEFGFKANFDRSGAVIKEIVKEFNRPSFSKPFVPDELKDWVDFDPDLRTMATDRIEANVARANIKLEFSQNLGLGGELSAKIADRGFSTCGKFKSVARSVWTFEVEYFDLGYI